VHARPQAENGRQSSRLPVLRSLESRLRPRACQRALRGRCARDLKCTAWFTLRRVAVCSSLEVVHARRHSGRAGTANGARRGTSGVSSERRLRLRGLNTTAGRVWGARRRRAAGEGDWHTSFTLQNSGEDRCRPAFGPQDGLACGARRSGAREGRAAFDVRSSSSALWTSASI
jgi:hypothetical protein